MGKTNSKQLLCDAITQDRDQEVKEIIKQNTNYLTEFINYNNDYNALCLATFYGSIKVIKLLLEVN
jgi:isocitrate dehydrogenase